MRKKIGSALIVGAGISGIRSALDLAETGYGVTLIDRSPHIGGLLSQLDYQFPTDRCGMCRMLPLVNRDASSQYCLRKGLFHENITIMLGTELVSVEGEPGKFKALLRQNPTWVDPNRCIGCNLCVPVCPVEVPNEFNAGFNTRKAIYLPVPHAIPNPYRIDISACTRCGECVKVCPTDAIVLSDPMRKKFQVLIVDDERIVRESLKEWLEDEGFSVNVAASGPEALEFMTHTPCQLMLLDIKMPDMDGVEVLKRSREISPNLDVVMMTAYATVDTAVEAMKMGALDYIIKPFDVEVLIPKIVQIFDKFEQAHGIVLEVGALILSGGTSFFDPRTGLNTYGYGVYPGVVTSIEFERIVSGSGPFRGELKRPGDGKPVRKIAWLQCVGSRDLQSDADFCSSACCMYSIKEAVLAKERGGDELEATIFYMDIRTFGKSFQRYRDRAEGEKGVRFVRGRVHSVAPVQTEGAVELDMQVRYADISGELHYEDFDLIVLAVGQRPAAKELAEMLELPLNPWGFVQPEPFSLTRTSEKGKMIGGSFSGLKDIAESVIQASSASLNASRVIHASGGSLAPEAESEIQYRDVSREIPKILIAICRCSHSKQDGGPEWDHQAIKKYFRFDTEVLAVEFVDQSCTAGGWESLKSLIKTHHPNRVLIGACLPYLYARKMQELGKEVGLKSELIEVVDIYNGYSHPDTQTPGIPFDIRQLGMGVAKLRNAAPIGSVKVPVFQEALVIGGGIAGMTAALAIADHGFAVHLVEKSDTLGGNLKWLKRTLEGEKTDALLEETLNKVQKHPLIHVYTSTNVVAALGQVGHFMTTLEGPEKTVTTLEHGITILATGGTEAPTTSYAYGKHDGIITQKELEEKLDSGAIDPAQLDAVVMIQCVDSREEPRNYCSRVCCPSSLKYTLHLTEKQPDMSVFVLYRDMMACGFTESYYTLARKRNAMFIQYDPEAKPEVLLPTDEEKSLRVRIVDPIIGKPLEISTNLIVLGTGIVPNLPKDLAEAYGAELDVDGFFREADSKWRPVDSLKEGIFACGIALSPRTITESIATAEAAAQRALRILNYKSIESGKLVAGVHHALCSLCEYCIETCPYGARTLDEELGRVVVNPVMCQGCGACAAVCPNSASYLEGFSDPQIFSVIDAVAY